MGVLSDKSTHVAVIVVLSGIMQFGHSRIVPGYTMVVRENEPIPNTGEPVWGYSEADGPHTWSRNFASCSGQRQSPIDLVSEFSIHRTVSRHKEKPRLAQHLGFAGTFESALDFKVVDLVELEADSGVDVDLSGDHVTIGADAGV